jgi:hypothetical protein
MSSLAFKDIEHIGVLRKLNEIGHNVHPSRTGSQQSWRRAIEQQFSIQKQQATSSRFHLRTIYCPNPHGKGRDADGFSIVKTGGQPKTDGKGLTPAN